MAPTDPQISQFLEGFGGRTRARTWDPLIKSQLLYQLSYAPGRKSGKPLRGASFSKATPGCPASRRKFSRSLVDRRECKKPLDFSGFCRCSDGGPITGRSKPLGPASVPTAVPVIPVSLEAGAPVSVAVH